MTTSTSELIASIAAKVVVTDDLLIAELVDGRVISAPIGWYPRLVHATPQERDNIEMYDDGTIHWPDLDEDISVEGLLAGRRSLESEASFARWLAAKRAGRGLTLADLRHSAYTTAEPDSKRSMMFKTNPVSLKDLLGYVDSGKIQLPDFQRGWVWDDYRIIGLLASISRGFPVGAIMTLDSGGDIKFKPRPIEGVSIGEDISPDSFLLDGQQRLTSLYQSLLYDGPVNTQTSRNEKVQRWYYIDMQKALNPLSDREDAFVSVDESKKSTYDFGRQISLDLSTPELEYENHMMPTERLLNNTTRWIVAYISYWTNRADHPTGNPAKFIENFEDSIIQSFSAYDLPVISLEKETPKEAVCTVFQKVNTGGVTLNVFELVTASFAADNFRLREDWAERSGRMRSGYGVLQGIEGEHFLQAVTLLTTHERRKTAAENGVPNSLLTSTSKV